MKVISQLLIPNIMMSNLERMIATRAMGTAIISNLSSEYSLERVFLEVFNFNNHSQNTWLFSLIIIYIYGQLKFNEGTIVKLKTIEIYDNYTKLIRKVLFVVFLVFTRDIQNAI